jgi:hypothetical protein
MPIDQIDGGAAAPEEEQQPLSLRESLEQQFADAHQAQDAAAASGEAACRSSARAPA